MKKTCAAVLAIGMAILWAGGCQEEQASSGDQMARLMGAENRDLRAQLQAENKNLQIQLQAEKNKRDNEIKDFNSQMQKRDGEIKDLNSQLQAETKKRDDEIKNLKTQLQSEMKKRDDDANRFTEKLAQCEQARQKSIKEQEEEEKRLGSMISDLMGGDTKLVGKVKRLEAELADCKGKE
jgi:DNA anti-recombination protein RmuC